MSITKTGFATLTNRLHAGENNSVFCRRDVCMSWSTCIQVSVEWWYTGAVVHVSLVITRCHCCYPGLGSPQYLRCHLPTVCLVQGTDVCPQGN